MKMSYCDPIILHLLDIVDFIEVMLEQSYVWSAYIYDSLSITLQGRQMGFLLSHMINWKVLSNKCDESVIKNLSLASNSPSPTPTNAAAPICIKKGPVFSRRMSNNEYVY